MTRETLLKFQDYYSKIGDSFKLEKVKRTLANMEQPKEVKEEPQEQIIEEKPKKESKKK